jgi:hypothetical protein
MDLVAGALMASWARAEPAAGAAQHVSDGDDANDHHAPGRLAVLSHPTRLLSTEFVAKPFEDAR